MAIERVYGFGADNEDLVLYDGEAILDLAIDYSFEDGTLFTFPGYVSSFLYVYDDETRTNLVKTWTTQITRNSNVQVINASAADCIFDGATFYYELGYVRSGYNQTLRYGKLFIK